MDTVIFDYVTECGALRHTGDRVYSHYTCQSGVIGKDLGQGWFDFVQDDGTSPMLNGQRICTLETARRWNYSNVTS